MTIGMTIGGAFVSDSNTYESPAANGDRDIAAQALDEIRASLRGLRFGSVNIIVQDGVVIQIDRTEKRRLRVSRPKHGH